MILDSCFVIDLMAGDAAAVAKLDELTDNAQPLAVTALSVTEVGVGLRSERAIETFDRLIDRFTVVPFGAREARRAAQVQRSLIDEGNRVGAIDVMIAATAVERSEPIVTRNVSEFDRVDDVRVSPY